MIRDVVDDVEKARKNHWLSIFRLMGVQAGQQQNVVQQLLDSYNSNADRFEKVFSKFQRGEKIEKEDLVELISESSNVNINLTVGNSKSGGGILSTNKSRASNNYRTGNRSSMSRLQGQNSIKSVENPKI